MTKRPALFIDRDGVINELATNRWSQYPEGPLSVDDVILIDGVTAALAKVAKTDFALIGITNQPSAAKRLISVDEQDAIHARVEDLLAKNNIVFEAWKICPHHPEGVVKELAFVCDCRKPKPGLILEAAEALNIDCKRSWTIGDSDSDVEAGRAAGTRTILIGEGTTHKRASHDRANLRCHDLAAAIEAILHDRLDRPSVGKV